MATTIDTISELEWLPMSWNSADILIVGRVYAYTYFGRRPDGTIDTIFTPVTITKTARHGICGSRVECSDGINRYQAGSYRGKHRADQSGKTLNYRLNPHFAVQRKPHVQLSLFDFETGSS